MKELYKDILSSVIKEHEQHKSKKTSVLICFIRQSDFESLNDSDKIKFINKIIDNDR